MHPIQSRLLPFVWLLVAALLPAPAQGQGQVGQSADADQAGFCTGCQAVVDGIAIPSRSGYKTVDSTAMAQLHHPGEEPQDLSSGMELKLGDRIETQRAQVRIRILDPQASAWARLFRKEILLLPAESSLELGPGWELRLLLGSIFIKVNRPFQAVTRNVTTGVKGTRYLLEALDESGRVTVYEGHVQVNDAVWVSRRYSSESQRRGLPTLREQHVLVDHERISFEEPALASRFRAMEKTWLLGEPRFSFGAELLGAALLHDGQSWAAAPGAHLRYGFRFAPHTRLACEVGFWNYRFPYRHPSAALRIPLVLSLEFQRIPLLQPDPEGPARWLLALQSYNELGIRYDDLSGADWQATRDLNLAMHFGTAVALRRERVLTRQLRYTWHGRLGFAGNQRWDRDYRHLVADMGVGLAI